MALVITRRKGESILIGDNIEVRICQIDSGRVFVSVDAPKEVTVWRKEVADKMNGSARKHAERGNCWCGRYHLKEEIA